ncbi:hypothetical protein UVI_02017360 [Ustilaginoidea virens]|uniref:CSC1/OSCA1-like cytosolic domain-containing protein n=1 Tax=Ustilaginoidea virens TaxID=1159556 RepID=A0A1B5KS14_USTVR|nr:hypothetical protein UVI_02017360 [Ustilaginoidea virens]
MLTCVPREYQDERRLRKLYGDAVKRVFIPRTSKALAKLVKEREQTAERLEKAEITLIKTANQARQKRVAQPPESVNKSSPASSVMESTRPKQDLAKFASVKTVTEICTKRSPEVSDSVLYLGTLGDKICKDAGRDKDEKLNPQTRGSNVDDEEEEYTHPYGLSENLPDVRGSVAAQWIPVEKRPYHRPMGNFFRRQDTIRWTRLRLRQLNVQIHKMRKQIRRDEGATLPTVFVEFYTQEAAQAAHQVLSHHRPLQMSNRLLGVRPDEVIWSCLRMTWWELIIRRFTVLAIVTMAVIFWAIPSAFIGTISNIDSLIERFAFLSFLHKLPTVILNFIQSFLPPVALTMLMAIVPWLLRCKWFD